MQKFTKYINQQVFENYSLNESDTDDKIKIIVLSNISNKSYTIPELEKEFKKKDIQYKIIDIKSCVLEQGDEDTGDFFISDKKTKHFKINGQDTAILTRRGVIRNTYTKDIVLTLEKAGFFVINSIESIISCENKYVTSKLLSESGVSVPKTAIVTSDEDIEKSLKDIGGKFPVILKTLTGSHGIGVSIIESEESLKSVLQTLWKVAEGIEVLIQEMIESEYDLRIHVLTKKFNSPEKLQDDSVILGAMKRNRVEKDFRTNYSLGATVEKIEITKEQEQIAIDSARAVGCKWCGVDIIVDKKGRNYVLEVNSSPGTQGFKKATGINVVEQIVDFLSDRDNWTRDYNKVGFREVIDIPEIGKMVAKFDTGNGSASCSITYDKMEVDEKSKTVKWKLGRKDFKNKIIGYSNAEVGDEVHERPIIEVDIIFANKLYKKVHVSLVDRKDKSTKFLVNRKFMERIGCAVDPSKTFILTKAPKNYKPNDSKGNSHDGIEFTE